MRSKNQAPYVIAEIGINHNGSLETALDLVQAAKDCGVDAVKFQKRTPEICVPEHQKSIMRETPWGLISYLEYKKRMELSPEQYEILFEKSKSLGLDFGFSAWDIESLNDLDHIEVDFQKIASAMSTNLVFLAEVSKKDKWIIASTGMTTWEEVDNLVSVLRGAREGFTLLHTVSTYPAKESDLNLQMIKTLQTRYNCEVGYSGHEASVSPSIFACALGAKVIERHFTLNRADWGTDHSASLEPAGMRRLVGSVKKWPMVLGDGEKREIEGEAEIASKLRYWI